MFSTPPQLDRLVPQFKRSLNALLRYCATLFLFVFMLSIMANDRCDLLRISGEDAVASEGNQHAGEGIDIVRGWWGANQENGRLRPTIRRGERRFSGIFSSTRARSRSLADAIPSPTKRFTDRRSRSTARKQLEASQVIPE